MQRAGLPPRQTPTYVSYATKVVYVSVAKAACTSLTWLMAQIQGEDPEQFHASDSPEVSRALTIHQRRRWAKTPSLHDLRPAELARIDTDWFVFAVVRHPTSRLWSAWQSKLLLREPRFHRQFGAEAWFPRLPAQAGDVEDDFRAFVRFLDTTAAQPVLADRHFRSQTESLNTGVTPYTAIYRTSQLGDLLDDLHAHLRRHGDHRELRLRRSNETPLPLTAAVLADGTDAAIRAAYRRDFEELGFDDLPPPPTTPYSQGQLDEVTRLVERAERIGDLSRRCRQASWPARLRLHRSARHR